jgi:hypothetical protein
MSDSPFNVVATTTSTYTVTPTSHPKKHPHRPKIASIENQLLSDLLGYSGLILTCILALLFLIRHYLFEAWLFPRVYRRIWTKMVCRTVLRSASINGHMGIPSSLARPAARSSSPLLRIQVHGANLNARISMLNAASRTTI